MGNNGTKSAAKASRLFKSSKWSAQSPMNPRVLAGSLKLRRAGVTGRGAMAVGELSTRGQQPFLLDSKLRETLVDPGHDVGDGRA